MPNFSSQVVSLKVASSKFLPKKERALLSLLEGANVTEAAAKSGAHERTIRRWLKDPEFQKRLIQARLDLYREGLEDLLDGSRKAVKRLIDLLDSPSEKTVLKAAELLLNFGSKVNTEQEHERRIQGLEERLNPVKALHESKELSEYESAPNPISPEDRRVIREALESFELRMSRRTKEGDSQDVPELSEEESGENSKK